MSFYNYILWLKQDLQHHLMWYSMHVEEMLQTVILRVWGRHDACLWPWYHPAKLSLGPEALHPAILYFAQFWGWGWDGIRNEG